MIVSERPGTTRDSVDVRFELDGLPFLAIDTAGRQAQGEDPREPRLLLGPPGRAVDPPGRRRPAVPRPDAGDQPARQAAGRLHRPAVQALHLRGQQVGPDGQRPRRSDAEQHGPVRQPDPARVPHDGLHAHRVHHGQDRQERQGDAQPGPVAVQAVAASGSAPGRSTASSARPSRPIPRPRARTGIRGSTTPPRWTSPRRRSSCSSTAPGCSTRPTSATCSTSSARSSPFNDIPIKLYLRARKQEEPGGRGPGGRPEAEADEIESTWASSPSGSSSRPGSAATPRRSTRRRGSSTTRSTSCSPTWRADDVDGMSVAAIILRDRSGRPEIRGRSDRDPRGARP